MLLCLVYLRANRTLAISRCRKNFDEGVLNNAIWERTTLLDEPILPGRQTGELLPVALH